MSEIEWKDATSYSQGQRGKVEPLSWECYVNGIRVWVSQGHIAYRGEWVVSCRELDITTSRIWSGFCCNG